MTQLMMMRTETHITPSMTSRIVPAGGFSKASGLDVCCGDGGVV